MPAEGGKRENSNPGGFKHEKKKHTRGAYFETKA